MAQAPARDDAPIRQFRDWIVGCDNTLACTALGKTEDSDWLLRLDRGAGDAPVRVSLVDVPASGPAAIRLVVDGQARGPALRLSDAAEGVRRAPLPPAEVPAILAALRDGRTGGVMGPDARLLGTLPMGGYAAALRWMDARQGRAGTPGAVIATGNGTAPPPVPAAPRIALAGLPSQAALPRRPASLRAEALSRECDQPRGEADVARLGPDLLFWLLPCAAGAYNFASLPVLTDARGGSPRVVALPGVPGRPAGLPVNAAFEARTNRLTQFNKGRGIGDCGTAGTWGWAGDRFALLEWREMPDCRGIPDTDWIVLHRSPG